MTNTFGALVFFDVPYVHRIHWPRWYILLHRKKVACTKAFLQAEGTGEYPTQQLAASQPGPLSSVFFSHENPHRENRRAVSLAGPVSGFFLWRPEGWAYPFPQGSLRKALVHKRKVWVVVSHNFDSTIHRCRCTLLYDSFFFGTAGSSRQIQHMLRFYLVGNTHVCSTNQTFAQLSSHTACRKGVARLSTFVGIEMRMRMREKRKSNNITRMRKNEITEPQ